MKKNLLALAIVVAIIIASLFLRKYLLLKFGNAPFIGIVVFFSVVSIKLIVNELTAHKSTKK